MIDAIRITARPQKGFWRCGIHHPAQPVDHPTDRFDDAQVERLLVEPNLVVELVAIGPEPGAVAPGTGARAQPAASPDPSPPGGETDPEPTRENVIREAMRRLGDDKALYTSSGKPRTEALEALLGMAVSARERDALWDEIQAATE